MGRPPIRADSLLVASPAAAFPTADERMRRTERQLIDAALAVNEACALDEALAALACSARELVAADRVSILLWDVDVQAAQIVASSGGEASPFRLDANEATARLVRSNAPFIVGPEHLEGLTDDVARQALAFGTLLCVPLSFEGLPTVSFQAIWRIPVAEQVSELAISKLRLLGRLTRVAFRTETERARAREDARLRAVIEAVPDGLVVRTSGGAIVNSAARELLADDRPPEAIGLRELDGTPVPSDQTPLAEAVRTGEPQSYVLRVTRGDGVERIHEGRIAPVVDDEGDVFATVTVFRDVTEAEKERFVTQQFLDSLFESLPTAVAVTDPGTWEIRRVNQAFLDLLGFDVDEAVGAKPPFPWWTEDYEIPRATPDNPILAYERLLRRKDGALVPARLTKALIRDPDGAPAAEVVLIADLSERRAFEQQLIQSGKLASIGELAAGVAHEINNPLFAILGLVEFLLLDAEPETKGHERLTLIQGTALEIKEIVRALLDFARERSDERSLISLTDVAAQTVELMRRTSAAKQVDIVERYSEEATPIEGSASQLKQIFVNLISNAKHALKDGGGTITVEIGRDGEYAWAEVRDTGPGLSEDVAARVFEPFFTTRRDIGGTGLGLSVSLGIAQAHGGSLVVDSMPGEGATFHLRLPLAEECVVA
jgi:PAS domain S-box-containing protein